MKRIVLPCLVLLALFVRVLALVPDYIINSDGVQYVSLAENLFAGDAAQAFSVYWSPLYPLLIGLASLVVPDAVVAGRIVSVVAGSLLVVPVYLLARLWYEDEEATVAALLVIFNQHLLEFSISVMTEATYILLLVCGVLTGWRALAGGRTPLHFLTGIIFGACYLLKPEAFGYAGLMAALIVFSRFLLTPKSWSAIARDVFLFAFGFMLLATPYLIYLRSAVGAWTISAKFERHFMATGFITSETGVAPDPGIARTIMHVLRTLETEHEALPHVLPPIFILLVGVGLFRSSWTRQRIARELYLMLFVLSTLLGYAFAVVEYRYLVPLLPVFLCWTARGVVGLDLWAAETLGALPNRLTPFRFRRGALRIVVVSALVIYTLPAVSFLKSDKKRWEYRPFEVKYAGLWIKEQGMELPAVMSTDVRTAFYAGGRHVEMPGGDIAALLDVARREKVDYIVADRRRMKPDLQTHFDRQTAPAGLRLVYTFDRNPTYKIFVYEFDPQGREAVTFGVG